MSQPGDPVRARVFARFMDEVARGIRDGERTIAIQFGSPRADGAAARVLRWLGSEGRPEALGPLIHGAEDGGPSTTLFPEPAETEDPG